MAKKKGETGRGRGRPRKAPPTAPPPVEKTTSGGGGSATTTAPPDDLGSKSRAELLSMRSQINTLLGETTDMEEPERKAAPNQGNVVQVFGADPTQKYTMRYEVRSLHDLIASNTDSGAINPDYPEELQPRDRTRAASRAQIDKMAKNLQSDAMTGEFNSLDRGTPIIGADNVVESGNGRTMALRRAALLHPEKYNEYREELRRIAAERGIDPAAVDQYENPVLVRVRVDDVDRVEFAKEANTATILGMSDTERAKSDASRIARSDLILFETGYGKIDQDLMRASNRDFVRNFVSTLPESERAEMMTRKGELTQTGRRRIKAAMFNRVYDAPQISDRIFEDTDDDMRNISNALMNSLGQVARAEEMVQSGQRDRDLSISDDIAAAVGKLGEIKARDDMSVEMYLAQQSMFGDDLTDTQKDIMVALHERRRSGKKLTELLSQWSVIVEDQPHPDQGNLFGPVAGPSKRDLVEKWLTWEERQQPSLF